MSQSDIFDLLKNVRLSGDESYYDVNKIKRLLKSKDISIIDASIYDNLKKLRRYGFLEFNFGDRKNKTVPKGFSYRLKKEYL